MSNMIAYSEAVLRSLADFLMAEPIMYLWAMILFAILVKVITGLLHTRF